MKTVSKIQTHDGALHETHGDGRRHLEKMLGSIVSPLAHRLHGMKYAEKVEAMAETEIETMRQILRIVDDMGLDPTETDEEE